MLYNKLFECLHNSIWGELAGYDLAVRMFKESLCLVVFTHEFVLVLAWPLWVIWVFTVPNTDAAASNCAVSYYGPISERSCELDLILYEVLAVTGGSAKKMYHIKPFFKASHSGAKIVQLLS
jgi:hypothetical protein